MEWQGNAWHENDNGMACQGKARQWHVKEMKDKA
jgi:hypothetical protein